MKLTTKLNKAAVGLASVAVIALGAGHALAFTDGQISGGDIYRAEDLTQNTGFSDTTTAKACDLLEYRVRLYNPGSATVNDVNVQASVSNEALTSNQSTIQITSPNADPASVYGFTTVNFASAQTESYVAGSTQLLDQNDNLIQGLPDGIAIGGTGVNAGNIGPSVTEFVQFQERVNCPTPPPASPTYTCNTLGITVESNRTIKVSAFGTTATNGATFTHAVINWGDNSSALTTSNAVGQTHQYAANGTYTVTATAHFNVNGQDVTAGGPQCQQQVTFSPTTPPTVTPPPATPPATPTTPAPTALVNTGPGSVVSLFGATSAIGAVAYRWMLSRRLSRQ